MSLTDFERAALINTALTPCADGCHCKDLARELADDLRLRLEGIDDVTIARVLIHASAPAHSIALTHHMDGTQLAALLRRTAVPPSTSRR